MPLVKLYASLRTISGKKELRLPGGTVQEVLGMLIRDYPALRSFLFDEERLRPRVILTVNGQTLDAATGWNTPISEQDQIAIFPPVAGG